MTAVTRAREVFDESLVDATKRVVTTRLFHLGTFQLAEVSERFLCPIHLSSSLWQVLHGRNNKFPCFQAAVVHSQ